LLYRFQFILDKTKTKQKTENGQSLRVEQNNEEQREERKKKEQHRHLQAVVL
jgi:hypothetical protein